MHDGHIPESIPMDARYHIADTSDILSPGLVLFREQLEQNIDHMLQIGRASCRERV